jgi:hypothetical protein
MQVNEYANVIRVLDSVSGVLFGIIWVVCGFYRAEM